jgi:hypothetical protein
VGGLAGAWILGEAIVIWRQVHISRQLPVPGQLVGITGLFAALALIADMSTAARPVVTLLAWGLDIAGLLNVLPAGLGGDITTAQNAEAAAEGESGAITAGTAGNPGSTAGGQPT